MMDSEYDSWEEEETPPEYLDDLEPEEDYYPKSVYGN